MAGVHYLATCAFVCMVVTLAGCGRKPDAGKDQNTTNDAGNRDRRSAAPRSPDHAHGHDAASMHDLGAVAIGAVQVHAVFYGTLSAGAQCDVDIRLQTADPRPIAVRAWIGSQDAQGSIKTRAEEETDHYHAHVEVPEAAPTEAKLWIELEWEDGRRATGSFEINT